MKYVGLPFGAGNGSCMHGTVWLLGFMMGCVGGYAIAKPVEFKRKIKEIMGR